MKKETMEYLESLQEKINNTESDFVEPNEDFNRGYKLARQLTIYDVVSAIKKIEGW